MHRRLFLFALAPMGLASCSLASKVNPFVDKSKEPVVSETQKKRGYVNLFPKDNFDHWVIMGDPAGWNIQNGLVRSEGGKGGNWIRSKKEYKDFILKLDYRVSAGGNSGVFIRALAEGEPWVTGHECQISNEQPPRDSLHCTGTLYGNVPVKIRPDESPDVWHTYEIRCVKNRITVLVDGKKTVDVDQEAIDAIKDKPLSGFVGLQDSHTAEGYWVEFRNVIIREL